MFDFFKSLSTVKGYVYNIWSPKGVIDQFAYPVMRDYFPEQMEQLEGWTKAGATSAEVVRIFEEVRGGKQNEDIELDRNDQWFLDLATKKVRCLLGDWKVQPLGLDDAMLRLHPDTSAGFGYQGKKKSEVFEEIRKQAKDLEVKAKEHAKINPLPCLLGTRGALHRETDPKRRIIYNVPSAQVALEQCFVGPLIDKAKQSPNYPIMFGKNVIPRLSEMNVKHAHPRGSHAVQLDVKSFDRNLRTATLRRGFTVMEDMIDFDTWKGTQLGESKKRRWKRVWDYTVYYFLHTPVMLPDGKIEFLDGSVPSGSGYTQFIESICSLIMFMFFALKYAVPVIDLKSLGDDLKAIVMGRPDIKLIEQVYGEIFFAVINTKKTRFVRADAGGQEFLGYRLNKGFLKRDSFEWFNLMLHPENEVKDLPTSFSRLTAYMFLGGVNDNEFSRFYETFQSCWPIENWDFVMTKDIKTKMLYGGLEFTLKKLLEYKRSDFVWSLITFKD